MPRLRKVLGWIFAVECLLFAFLVEIIHVPPQHGQPFIDGGDASSLFTTIEVCTFYFVVISVLGTAWWTIWKAKPSSSIWGIAASIASLFWYMDPSCWYQIHRRGVWIHWAICLVGLIVFISPQSEAHTSHGQPAVDVPRGGICYAFGIVFPLAYLLSVPRDKQNLFLRFHCIQCVLLSLFWTPFLIYIDMRPAKFISTAVFLLFLFCYLTSWTQANHRKQFRLPIIGSVAARLS